jgi:hypothetical protein
VPPINHAPKRTSTPLGTKQVSSLGRALRARMRTDLGSIDDTGAHRKPVSGKGLMAVVKQLGHHGRDAHSIVWRNPP